MTYCFMIGTVREQVTYYIGEIEKKQIDNGGFKNYLSVMWYIVLSLGHDGN